MGHQQVRETWTWRLTLGFTGQKVEKPRGKEDRRGGDGRGRRPGKARPTSEEGEQKREGNPQAKEPGFQPPSGHLLGASHLCFTDLSFLTPPKMKGRTLKSLLFKKSQNSQLRTPFPNVWTSVVTASHRQQDAPFQLGVWGTPASLISYSAPLLTPQRPLHLPICRWLCFPNLIDADRYIVSASPDCQRLLKSNDFISPNNLEDFFFLLKAKKKKRSFKNASFLP